MNDSDEFQNRYESGRLDKQKENLKYALSLLKLAHRDLRLYKHYHGDPQPYYSGKVDAYRSMASIIIGNVAKKRYYRSKL